MNSQRPKKSAIFCFFCLIFLLSLSHLVSAQQQEVSEEGGQEAAAYQAQATMASLFGRGAKMPRIPHINGTIALPAFDSRGMKIDEAALNLAQRREPSPENDAGNS